MLFFFLLIVFPAIADSASDYNDKGIDLARLGMYEEAIVAFDRSLTINPDCASTWCNKGAALNYLGKSSDAISAFDIALSINPDYGDAWYNKGVALSRLDKFEEAVAAYDKALFTDFGNAMAWYNKGNAHYNLGEYDDAIFAFNRALFINSDYKWAWNNKGLALYNLGKYEEAISAYDECLLIDPNHPYASENKKYALDMLKKEKENSAPVSTPTFTPVPTSTPVSTYNSSSAGSPDLIVKNVFAIYSKYTNEITCEVVIANTGSEGTGRFNIGYFISGEQSDNPFEDGATILYTDDLANLAAGKEQESRSEKIISIPPTVPEGVYYFGIYVDSGNDVAEDDEKNNILYDTESVPVQ